MNYNLKKCFKSEIYTEQDIKFVNEKVEECANQQLFQERIDKIEDKIADIRQDIELLKNTYIENLFDEYEYNIYYMIEEQNCLSYYIGMQQVIKNSNSKNFLRENLFTSKDIKYIERKTFWNVLNNKEVIESKKKIEETNNKEVLKLLKRYNSMLKKRILVENCLAYYLGIQTCFKIKEIKNLK